LRFRIPTLFCFRGISGKASFFPDGRTALCVSDGVVHVLDVEALREVCHFGEGVASAVASTDGRQILAGGREARVRLFDAQIGKELRAFDGHQGFVLGVALSASGLRAVSCGFDNTVRLWDAATGKELHPVDGPTDECIAIAISPDCRRLITGNWNSTLRFWDLPRGKETSLLTSHKAAIKAVAFSADGRRALSGSDDGTMRLWNAETGQEARCLRLAGQVPFAAIGESVSNEKAPRRSPLDAISQITSSVPHFIAGLGTKVAVRCDQCNKKRDYPLTLTP
jgi:WD40 repeat protein